MHMDQMTQQTLPNWLLKRAQTTPDRTAVIWESETITFQELHNKAIEAAVGLMELGVRKGDHVAVLFPNSLELVVLIHALEYIGAVAVLLNIRLTPYELGWQIADSESKLLLYHHTMQEKANQIKEQSSDAIQFATYQHIADRALAELHEIPEKEKMESLQTEFNMHDVHTIVYTSGTTGRPKGVLLRYENHWWSAIGSMLNLGLQTTDVWLACVPLFHVSGLSILMRSVIYGMPIILHATFDPVKVNDAICKQGVTVVSVVSNMLTRMTDELLKMEIRYPDTFRCMLLGGGPAPLPLLETCTKLGIPVYQTYGMTETASQIVTLAPEYMLSKLGSAGKPLFQAQLAIRKDGRLALPHEIGEIVVKGLNVTSGYFKREDATKEAIRDGWFYTGDLGYLDEDGFLYVVDRRSDLIISGGENIYPAEVETALLTHPAVAEAGVTGIEDPQWGQVPIAFCVLRSNQTASPQELIQFCKERLAGYKIPRSIYLVEELPRNASRKLLRRELRKMIPTE
jgi:o-succinylbenzoate---CoA ligase